MLQLDDSTLWSLSRCKDVGVSVTGVLRLLSCSVDVPSDNRQEAVVCQGSLHRLQKHANRQSKEQVSPSERACQRLLCEEGRTPEEKIGVGAVVRFNVKLIFPLYPLL